MRPLSGLTWRGTAYAVGVILVGALLVPIGQTVAPVRGGSLPLLVYLGVLTQVASLMPTKWRHGSQTVDTMPLVAASIVAPGVGPALLAWLCSFDGRRPSRELPLWQLLFNRGRAAIEFAIPSLLLASLPLPPEANVPVKALGLAAGTLLIGYPLTAKAFALTDQTSFWKILTANVGLRSVSSVLILSMGGGVLYMVLQFPGGYLMGVGMLGLLLAVRSNMADSQRQQLERIQTLEVIAQALDARDPMTELHSQRVSNMAVRVARVLGMSDIEVERIRIAGLLHDVGKIGVPDSVLKKPTRLSADEWAVMRRHADAGADMLMRHSALRPMAPWVRYHHERWDGSGYPSGLVGPAIPMGARILAVADSFDTITGPRVYRTTSMSPLEAVEDISRTAGRLYDPVVVNALRQLHDLPHLAPPDTADRSSVPSAMDLVRSNGRLRALTAGMTVSSIGDPLTTVAVTVTAYSVTHSGFGVAAAMVLRAASMMAAGAVLGGALDRWPRRTVAVCADAVQMAALLAAPILLGIYHWALFGLVVALGAAAALGQASRDAGIPSVVADDEIPSANGIIATGTNIGPCIGYPLAAVLVWLLSSTGPLYLLDAATFAIAALMTLAAGPLGGGAAAKAISGALRSSFALASVRPLLVVAGFAALLLSMTGPVVIVLATELSDHGPRTYTLLEVVLTAGMAVGAISFAWVAKRARATSLLGLAMMAVLSLATAISPVLIVSAVLLFVASVGNQLYVVGNRTELQVAAPRDRIGSVMATRAVIVQTLAIAGSAIGGVVCTAVGARMTYAVVGAGLAVISAVVGVRSWARGGLRERAGFFEAAPQGVVNVAGVEVAESA